MINRELVVEQFNKYVKDYDAENSKIALKIAHTYRVADISERIIKRLIEEQNRDCNSDELLSDEDIDTAWVIGMLHDIARFEQVKRYNTFEDAKSVNHAEFGVKLLFEDNLIDRFDIDKSLYNVIDVAIRNHNKYRIEDGISEKDKIFCKIIRDADKIDIIRVNYETPMAEIYNTSEEALINDAISDDVYNAFFEKKAISHSLKRTCIDRLIGHISLAYELEFPVSYEILKEAGYLYKLMAFESNNAETRERLKSIREYMNNFLG